MVMPETRSSSTRPVPEELVIFADADLLAINKPPGLLSLPHGFDPRQPHIRALLEEEFGRLWIVHRLDRDTSGIMVLARNPDAHRALNDQFAGRKVRKTYHALVKGSPEWETYEVQLPLRKNGDRRHRTVVDLTGGQAAHTTMRVLTRFHERTLVEAEPHSGRTHQIRVHLAALNLPLIGDSLYGDGRPLFLSMLKPGFRAGRKPECALIERPALHAHTLDCLHPNGETLHLQAPYPSDFNAAVRQLSRYARVD